MSAGSSRRAALTEDEARSLAERADRQREQLFNVASILKCCRNALATKYRVTDPEYMADALQAASEMVYGVAIELGDVVDGLTEVPQEKPVAPARHRRKAKNAKARNARRVSAGSAREKTL